MYNNQIIIFKISTGGVVVNKSIVEFIASLKSKVVEGVFTVESIQIYYITIDNLTNHHLVKQIGDHMDEISKIYESTKRNTGFTEYLPLIAESKSNSASITDKFNSIQFEFNSDKLSIITIYCCDVQNISKIII
ncbi:hypothetical protein KC980_03615 [candidate division WWE3 bacterium]|uniref:Uncharacterized protein n=1 Tax=candidate division WWE3 bacterium TaxID=2053526 RepID=A0A955EDH2_UNCKA|nr:hypothetical protein [candidate division WWE3 bacterium]